MATVLKCKMCGGDIEVSQDMTVGTCLFCGSTMTLPRIESEKKARLFNRANQYRLNNEFDKAYDAYRAIVDEDEQEAEAYWGLILSEYGVEYVEDPKTGKRIPTCHRTKVQSITASVNYKQALQFADAESKFIYQDEAEVLDKLQKNIIAVSAKEEPYDVFICYKESDEQTGERTQDSVLAQQLYDALQEKGIRTFFARISLEEKVGQNYEPFIYAALKSARVMVLVTTSNEHCNAIWVKNEWMRFVQFMEEDKNKSIIPACHEMSPYELPDELAAYQAQDLGKVGAIQDLVYGITKLLGRAPRESNNEIINELLEEKLSREKRTSLIIRGLIFVLVGFVALVAAAIFVSSNCFSNGYISLGFEDMAKRFRNILPAFLGLLSVGFLLDVVGMIYGLAKGYTRPWVKRMLGLGFVLLNIAILLMRFNGFLVPGAIYVYVVDLILVLIVTLSKIRRDRKQEALLRIVAIAVCTVIGFTNIGFTKEKIANATTVTSEDQITVTDTYAAIRAKADSSSAKLGEIYKGMVFDVLDTEKEGDYTWYKIALASGKEGYVRGDLVCQPMKVLITDDYINIRAGAGTQYDIIGKVNKGESYLAVTAQKQGSRTWYEIVLSDGTIGYIGANGIEVLN